MTVVQKFAQNFLNRHNAGHAVRIQHVHVHTETDFQFRLFKQVLHQQIGIHRPAFGFQNNTDIMGGFIANIAQHRQFFVIQKLGNFLN